MKYNEKKAKSIGEHNIFKYATKELSQDAFLCWLLSWYNIDENEDEEINKLKEIAIKFLEIILGKDDNLRNNKYKIEIKRQYKKMDVLILLKNKDNIQDNEYEKAIIIEDKIFSSEHDNQICKYIKSVIDDKTIITNNVIIAYFKMIPDKEFRDFINNPSRNIKEKVQTYCKEKYKNTYDKIIEKMSINLIGIGLEEVLSKNNKKIDTSLYKIINDYTGKSEILKSYKEYINKFQSNINNYKAIQFSDWKNNREIFYKFENVLNKEVDKKAKVVIVGGTYIDLCEINLKDEIQGRKLKINKLYLALNFMKEGQQYIDIRGKQITGYGTKDKKILDTLKKEKKELYDILSSKIKEHKILERYPVEIGDFNSSHPRKDYKVETEFDYIQSKDNFKQKENTIGILSINLKKNTIKDTKLLEIFKDLKEILEYFNA